MADRRKCVTSGISFRDITDGAKRLAEFHEAMERFLAQDLLERAN